MQIQKLIVACALALSVTGGLGGCVTMGHKFTMEQVAALKPGITTKDEAIALLGPPTGVSQLAGGVTLLQWMYNQATFVDGSARHVAVAFDADGKMIRVTHQFETGR